MPKEDNKKFQLVKKTIKDFIRDEDGFVTKDNILKIGLGTVSSVGLLSAVSAAYAAHISLTPCTLVVKTTFTYHLNELGYQAGADGLPVDVDTGVTRTCYRVKHFNNPHEHFNHVNRKVSGSGTGCLSGKGCASFGYAECGS
ncbi:MAG: hypothetical protein WCI77_01705 [Candidatus Omnitrophota bacterium]